MISLKVSLLAANDLEAVKLTLINNVENIALLSLSNDGLAGLGMHFLHGIDDNAQALLIK